MPRNKDLTALPSKVILQSGDAVLLDELKEKEREEIKLSICKNISERISNYYSLHTEEWENFLSVMK